MSIEVLRFVKRRIFMEAMRFSKTFVITSKTTGVTTQKTVINILCNFFVVQDYPLVFVISLLPKIHIRAHFVMNVYSFVRLGW